MHLPSCIFPEAVEARNFINAETVKYRDAIMPVFERYLNKKVIRSNPYHSLVAKLNKELKPIDNEFRGKGLAIIYSISHYSISVEMKTPYHRNNFYLGSLVKGGILYSLYDNQDHIYTQYDPKTVNETLKRIWELEATLSELKGSISVFL
jgi:hypothetical protein